MYLKSIEIENIGPIEHVQIDFPIEDAHPKPVIILGENGTGKSILLSHLVNSLITGKQEFFDDVEVEHGKVYKYRSLSYIRSGKDYSYSSVKFEVEIEAQECQFNRSKNDFENILGYAPVRRIWNNIQPGNDSIFLPTFSQNTESHFFYSKINAVYIFQSTDLKNPHG